MMKNFIQFCFAVFLFLWLVSGCTSNGPGPLAWIDQPIDNSRHPLAPVEITVHASDLSGVAGFEIFIDDASLKKIPVTGCTLCNTTLNWNPSRPGVYHISVQAVGVNGEKGTKNTASIQIGDVPSTKVPIPPTEMAIIPTLTPEVLITPTITVTLPSELVIQANSNANCRKGPGIAYDIDDTLYKDTSAAIEGRNQDNKWVLIHGPARGVQCWVAVSVGQINGNINDAPIVNAPQPPVSSGESQPGTNPQESQPGSPPSVSVSVSNGTLLTASNSCSNYPKTATVVASISAPNGISQVTMSWSQSGTQGSSTMSPSGGGTYTANIGPFEDAGGGTVSVQVVDTAGMTGNGGASFDVSSSCIQ